LPSLYSNAKLVKVNRTINNIFEHNEV